MTVGIGGGRVDLVGQVGAEPLGLRDLVGVGVVLVPGVDALLHEPGVVRGEVAVAGVGLLVGGSLVELLVVRLDLAVQGLEVLLRGDPVVARVGLPLDVARALGAGYGDLDAPDGGADRGGGKDERPARRAA